MSTIKNSRERQWIKKMAIPNQENLKVDSDLALMEQMEKGKNIDF
jgi:hypothetical protein